MRKLNQSIPRVLLVAAVVGLTACASPQRLDVYAARPLASMQVTVADHEAKQILNGASAVVPKHAKSAPNSVIAVSKSKKVVADDALTLRWSDAWSASLRVDGGAPVDLRPYLRSGVLAFDLNVDELSKGGLKIKLNCGVNCERAVPFLVPARAVQGKGWQHVVLSLNCFYRQGDDFSAVPQPFALDAGGTGQVAVANIAILSAGKPNASCPDYKTVSVTPDTLNESWSIPWWVPRHDTKLAEVKRRIAAKEKTDLVFIGDSITEGWEKDGAPVWASNYTKYNALALGFSGDRTENVLWRLQHGEVDGLTPKVAVLLFGTNNTGHRLEDPATTAAGIKRNIDELQQRLPNTRILLLAIFPRDEKADSHMRSLNDKINRLISGYADGKNIVFADLNSAFLDASGTLSRDVMPDLLHPNAKGYEIWARAMEPHLTRMLTN